MVPCRLRPVSFFVGPAGAETWCRCAPEAPPGMGGDLGLKVGGWGAGGHPCPAGRRVLVPPRAGSHFSPYLGWVAAGDLSFSTLCTFHKEPACKGGRVNCLWHHSRGRPFERVGPKGIFATHPLVNVGGYLSGPGPGGASSAEELRSRAPPGACPVEGGFATTDGWGEGGRCLPSQGAVGRPAR